MDITGGCVCGGTRYVVNSRPFALVDCHCIDCRRSAGAPYVQWGSVRREDLVVTKGKPRKIAHADRIRSFAACCGTHLFFEDSKDSSAIDVTIASLDDPTPFAPQKTIWLEDKLPWVKIDESLPSLRRGGPASQSRRRVKLRRAKGYGAAGTNKHEFSERLTTDCADGTDLE